METKQIKLLSKLAQKIKSEKKDKDKIVASLQSAKILSEDGNFTQYYLSLEKCSTKH